MVRSRGLEPWEFRAGYLLTGDVNLGERTRFGPPTFLLAPGEQDYVGDNSYDIGGNSSLRFESRRQKERNRQ
jgi:hypothetical protein